MEDEDSKGRRNFIAISTLVILAWWLQAPLDKISEKLLGMPWVGPEFEWRAWLAATVALLYFAMRFRFSKEHLESTSELDKELETIKKTLILKWVRLQTYFFVKWRIKPSFFRDNLISTIENHRAAQKLTEESIVGIFISSLLLGHKDTTGQIIPSETGKIDGTVRMVITKSSTERYEEWRSVDIDFEFDKLRSQLLSAGSWTWILIYSRASTSLAVPWVCGVAAVTICISKQIRSW